MNIKQAITHLVDGNHLSREQMSYVMQQIMTGKTTDAQIGGILVALRLKGETVDEITGAVEVMRDLATPVQIRDKEFVDTCGTGGDDSNLFNVSTASALVVAAAGGKVAKHGNRSVTSTTGSADLLEIAGVNLNISAEQVAKCVNEVGVGFMFAPAHHGAMKHAIGPRKELGLRTIFNILGPLTNPAGAKRQVIGVFSQSLCRTLAEVLKKLGSTHVLIVHSLDGLDEISLAGPTYVAELKNGDITEYTITPEEFGIEPSNLDGLRVTSARESLNLIADALGKRSTEEGIKAANLIALNAGAAIYVANLANSLKEAVTLAEDTIHSGLAGEKLKELVEFTNCF
jgi:anthranilate phosphoribosyltransferase